MSTLTSRWRGWPLAVLLLLLVMGPPPASAGDVDSAKLFLEAAKGKMRSRKYEDALLLLHKAASEDAHLLEIHWLEGQIHEKLKDPGAALVAYRRFLVLYAQKAQRGHLEKNETKLKKKAEKRVDVLAEGERALEAWEDEYVEDLVALAEKYAVDAPRVSVRALERVLEVRSSHARAVQLYTELGGTPPEDCASETLGKTPFDRWTYSSTTDLIAERSFGRVKGITYSDGLIEVVTDESGSIIQPLDHVAVAREYVYHASFRMTRAESSRWLSGLVFGIDGSGITRLFAVFVQRNRLVLHRVDQPKGEREDVADQRIPEIQSGVWHDLLVHVDGQKIVVFMDGKKTINYTAARTYDLKGGVGIYQQSSDSEYRALRVGRLE